nr:uncharacterized protein LOC112941498 [Solanum lycopersicum]
MPYALNVWIYECASNLNSEIAVRERNVISRICNWRVVSEKAKFEMLMSTIFQENACSNIIPTAEEIEAFDIAQVEHAHSTSIPLVQPNEEDDLDNFSTKPPEQLFRTYSRVSDTSPPPLPKRRKKLIIQKKKVSEQNQPDQSNVSRHRMMMYMFPCQVCLNIRMLMMYTVLFHKCHQNRLLMHMVLFQTLLRTRLLMFMDMQIHRMSTIKFLILKS